MQGCRDAGCRMQGTGCRVQGMGLPAQRVLPVQPGTGGHGGWSWWRWPGPFTAPRFWPWRCRGCREVMSADVESQVGGEREELVSFPSVISYLYSKVLLIII